MRVFGPLDTVWIVVGSTRGASHLTYWQTNFGSRDTPNLAIKGPLTTKIWPKIAAGFVAKSEGRKHLDQTGVKLDPTYQTQNYDLGTPNFGRERPKNAHENGQQAHLGAIFRKIWASFRSH